MPSFVERRSVIVLAGWLCFLLMLVLFWFGPRGSDDTLYWRAATDWFQTVPYIGPEHWDLRHTIVLPLVLARIVLGDGPLSLAMPSILAALAVIALAGVWVREAAGAVSAWFAVLLIATGPLLVLLSSTADIDFIEIAYVLASLFLLQRSMTRGPSWPGLLGSGVAMGLALVSRETSIFAVAALGLLFLAGYGMPRRWYLVFGIGLAVIVFGEMLIYWRLTGDPLYRLTISLHHDSTINRWTDKGSGLPVINPLIDPLMMLIASHDFGAGFLIGVPLVLGSLLWFRPSGAMRTLFVLLGSVAIVWTVVAAALWSELALVSRYYAMPLVGLMMLAAVCLDRLRRAGHGWLAWGLFAALILANVAGCALDNRNFMFGETALVAIAEHTTQPIHTDEETLRRSELMLRWAGVLDRCTDAPPGPGDLFLYNPPRAAIVGVAPANGWQVLRHIAPTPGWPQRLLAPIRPLLPRFFARKLGAGHPGVTLYRLPARAIR